MTRSSFGPSRSLPPRTERSIPSFLDLGVNTRVVDRLTTLGITDPLPIQAATVPEALSGRDVFGQAPTGSGKTLAFALPMLARITGRHRPGSPSGLVLVPTRELAQQVHSVLSSLSIPGQHRVVVLHGGTGYGAQLKALRHGVDIVVACPGRLEDLVARGAVKLDGVHVVVLDEADRMVDMGFLPPVRRLVDKTADDRQVLLFSATMTRDVEAISQRYQHAPQHCVVAPAPADVDAVTHLFWRAERPERVHITAQLIKRHGRAFIFCRTKRGADRVASQLRAAGVAAAAIHGDRSQSQRERALASFSKGQTHALVGTDVMARGIHVDAIPCVVHFDPAGDADTYVHRSGRTGRTGDSGTVVSLVSDEHRDDVHTLQRGLGLRPVLCVPFSEETVPVAARRQGSASAAHQARRAPRVRQSSDKFTRRPGASTGRRRARPRRTR